jgi:Tfp pilus assembly protein PilO
MLKKPSSIEKNILYTVILVVVLSAACVVLVGPLVIRWDNVNSRIELTKTRLRQSLSLMKDKDMIEKEYDSLTQRLKQGESDEQEITIVLDELEKAASRSNIRITSMRPRPVKQKEHYRQFEIEIKTESDMSSLMGFIYDIKGSPYLIKIDKLNLDARGSQQSVLIRAAMLVSKISV